MINQDYTRKNIFWNYNNIKCSLENDLRDIQLDTKKMLNESIQDIAFRLQLSLERNQEQIEQSMDALYVDVRNAFRNIFKFNKSYSDFETSKKFSYIIVSSNNTRKEKKNFEVEDAYVVENNIKSNELKNSAKNNVADNCYSADNIIQKSNYTSLINDVISKSGNVINNVAIVMAGKLCNSYGIKDRLPKRLWKWEARIDYLQGYLKESNLSERDRMQIIELRAALQKNKYLKSKRKDYYEKMDDCLAQYIS